jgi:hypothetical protein
MVAYFANTPGALAWHTTPTSLTMCGVHQHYATGVDIPQVPPTNGDSSNAAMSAKTFTHFRQEFISPIHKCYQP